MISLVAFLSSIESNRFLFMSQKYIEILGASEHNLKHIDIKIPKNQLVVMTGVSGSGKSSLAFDTIYAEGQRRYLESFSTYARQFIGVMERPNVDSIKGISPVVSIEQKTVSKNPRSTVGTITEIYDFLRLLFARASKAYSYNTNKEMAKMNEEEIISSLTNKFKGQTILVLASLVRGRKGHYRELFDEYRLKGFSKMRVDGKNINLEKGLLVDRYKVHNIDLILDVVDVDEDNTIRLHQSIQSALKISKGILFIVDENEKEHLYSQHFYCSETGISYEEPNPNSFSFNTPLGYCPKCQGIGFRYEVDIEKVLPDKKLSIREGGIAPIGKERDAGVYQELKVFATQLNISLHVPIGDISEQEMKLLLYGNGAKNNKQKIYNYNKGIVPLLESSFYYGGEGWWKEWAQEYMKESPCETCEGTRLKKESLFFKIKEKNIAELCCLDVQSFYDWFENIEAIFNKQEALIAKDILKEIRTRTQFLLDVGLHYLSLHLPSKTLSGGEAQRIRLATQIGSQLQGITYILDEPSIGLHQRDNQQLITALKHLRDIGNTVLVVEHDKEIMLAADYIIDIGPGAGKLGGRIVAEGTPKDFLTIPTLTSAYLSNTKKIEIPTQRREGNKQHICIYGVSGHNLKNIDVHFPLGKFIAITGVSGSGKSTLIGDTLYPILYQHTNKIKKASLPYKSIDGLDNINKVIEIDQSPIGRTPRSNPSTYCGFFTEIRDLYGALPESRVRAYKVGRFSFNVKGGRCEDCQGGGLKVMAMGFLPDVYVQCSTCNGKRYNRETLDIRYKGKSIYDVLEMTVDEAVVFFEAIPLLYRKIKTLQDVGLGYITLGQSSVTFSGGEAQRIKLATELSKRDTGKTFYILDEPTTGLHFKDIHLLIQVLSQLVDKGNTVLVIEHNLDMVKMADHVIDLGPEGGKHGGIIIAEGTPEEIVKNPKSQTGKYLKMELT